MQTLDYASAPIQSSVQTSGPASVREHAIVIGGSITGLLAGRVLADHYRQVTIIERDTYPQDPVPRNGVPQSRFLHVLLQRGQLILEDLFPGLAAELMAQGAPLLKDCQDVCFYSQYGAARREASSIESLSPTRGLLDWTIRRRLMQRPSISFLEGSRVTDLVVDSDQAGVSGVTVHTPNGAQTLSANLVVDASGKTSQAPRWLQHLGYDAPPETLIDAHIGYAHRVYQRPIHVAGHWQVAIVWPSLSEQTRSGILYPVEGDRWIVELGGAAPDHPPTQEANFLAYAQSLSTPAIYEAIKDATPLSDIYLYCGNENRLRAYHKLSPYPENFLVMGHAACAFNPVYAQGMTMAAIEAKILAQVLQRRNNTRPLDCHAIQHQLAQAEAIPWTMATEMDQRYVTRNQAQTLWQRCNDWYQNQLLQLVTEDSEVYRRMMLVTHMLKEPNTLMAPALLRKVMTRGIKIHLTQTHSNQAAPTMPA